MGSLSSRIGSTWIVLALAGLQAGEGRFDLEERRREHWSWRAVEPRTPPPVEGAGWARTPVDLFLLARLEAEGLRPAPEADRRVLARRLAHDLTGLPPDPGSVEDFLADGSPDAHERLVDRLLASPAFGERWARRWLDLVRYAETLGHEFDYPVPHAWRYRDYVIRAFDEDVSYDRFAAEHIAGDLLEEPRRDPWGRDASAAGTAFFWLTQQTHSPVDLRQARAEVVDNQIDVLAKTFLGLTAACARCHDHKFDAISTRDYYALHAILTSSRYRQAALPSEEIDAKVEALRRVGGEMRALAEEARALGTAGASAPGAGTPPALAFEEWIPDGLAFEGERPRGPDCRLTGGEDAPALERVPAGWVHSARLSRRLQGALRSPTFRLDRRFVHLLTAGKARVNLVIDGFTLIRDPIYGGLKRLVETEAPHWVTFDAGMWPGRPAYLELLDLSTPDLADSARGAGYGPDGWIAAGAVLLSDGPAPEGREGLEPFPRWTPPAGSAAADRLAAIAREHRRIEASLPEPVLVPAMAEGTGEDGHVLVRGDPGSLGEPVERRFLEAIAGRGQPPVGPGSGRRELARHVTDPANPFFARVMANRVWHHLFGRGIVPTTDDFGALGEPPSHPELLDWLAARFREDRWSVKSLVRLLAASSAYRMSSAASDPGAELRDPEDRLLHRMRARRMEGEAIRDAILALSGRLERGTPGPPVPVHLTPFLEGRGRPATSGPLDGAGRRSIYVEVRRNFLSPMMLAFDTPVPATTVGRRSESNVPAQALILMNDPFVAGQADLWARKALRSGPDSAEERVRGLYLEAFSRPPGPEELAEALRFLEEQGEARGLPPAARAFDEKVWADLCHAMFNVKELIFVP
ncbi:MAG: DUF1553 domain-containing protein [Planctomycetes bacterium]|nr:DUF1553 domain-containing protein [Planctomycetota bacterium]